MTFTVHDNFQQKTNWKPQENQYEAKKAKACSWPHVPHLNHAFILGLVTETLSYKPSVHRTAERNEWNIIN